MLACHHKDEPTRGCPPQRGQTTHRQDYTILFAPHDPSTVTCFIGMGHSAVDRASVDGGQFGREECYTGKRYKLTDISWSGEYCNGFHKNRENCSRTQDESGSMLVGRDPEPATGSSEGMPAHALTPSEGTMCACVYEHVLRLKEYSETVAMTRNVINHATKTVPIDMQMFFKRSVPGVTRGASPIYQENTKYDMQ